MVSSSPLSQNLSMEGAYESKYIRYNIFINKEEIPAPKVQESYIRSSFFYYPFPLATKF